MNYPLLNQLVDIRNKIPRGKLRGISLVLLLSWRSKRGFTFPFPRYLVSHLRSSSDRGKGAEQPVAFVVEPRREEEGVGRPRRPTVAKPQPPEAVNDNRVIEGIPEEPHESSGHRIKGGNLAAAEVPHQQLIAELAEISRCLRYPPRRVEPEPVFQAHDKAAIGVEDLDKAVPLSGHVVKQRDGIQQGIGDEQLAPYVHDVEGIVPRWRTDM